MSATVMYAAKEGGELQPFARFSNSWHGAMAVWLHLAEKYLSPPAGQDLRSYLYGTSYEPVWQLAEDARLSRAEKLVLLSTFDRFLAEGSRLQELADAFRAVGAAMKGSNSLAVQAAELERAQQEGVTAVGWQQTTVSNNLWWVRTGEDEGRAYDLARDSGHHWLFAVADA